MPLEPDYVRFKAGLTAAQTKDLSVELGRRLRAFCKEHFADADADHEAVLEAFFHQVMRYTGEVRDYSSENSHDYLVDNWRKGRSSRLAPAAYFYLRSIEAAKDLVTELEVVVFKQKYEAPPKPSPERTAGSLFLDRAGPEYPEMIIVPRGSFMMGSPQGEYDRDSFESPRHEVTFHQEFALARFPVTRAQYAIFVRFKGHPPGKMHVWKDGWGWEERSDRDWRNPGFPQDGDHPVVGVSYEDGQRYCDWLSARTGKTYRVPTEEEWEYACRAGSKTAFSWGDDITPSQANYDEREPYFHNGPVTDFHYGTRPVRHHEPNAWGFYQMHGNIWEWTSDPWLDNYRHKFTSEIMRQKGDFGRAVVRGGAWLSIPNKLRSSKRDWDGRNLRGDTLGFRVARDL